MSDSGPIDAFPTPHFLSLDASTFNAPDVAAFIPVIFALVFFIWIGYTLVVAYHLFRYSHRSFFTVPMLAVHVVVSGVLLLMSTAGLR